MKIFLGIVIAIQAVCIFYLSNKYWDCQAKKAEKNTFFPYLGDSCVPCYAERDRLEGEVRKLSKPYKRFLLKDCSVARIEEWKEWCKQND